jgi:hypothetical protein
MGEGVKKINSLKHFISVLLTVILALTSFSYKKVSAEEGFRDDFSTNTGIWSSEGEVFNGGGWCIEKGKCFLYAEQGKNLFTGLQGYTFSNFTLEVDVNIQKIQNTEPSPSAGVVFRSCSSGSYYAGIRSTKGTEVYLLKSGESWSDLAYGSMKMNAGEVYHLKIVANENNIKVYVNDMDTPKINYTDKSTPKLSKGVIGFNTYSTSSQYDNLVIGSYKNQNDDKKDDKKEDTIIKVLNPDNGHSYAVFHDSKTWKDAKVYCESIEGHLATITTQKEHDFISNLVTDSSNRNYWLGATDEVEEGIWRWITGETFEYSNWAASEPNNCWGQENYLSIYPSDNTWNDYIGEGDNLGNPIDLFGFICEWEPEVVDVSLDKTNNEKNFEIGKTINFTAKSKGLKYIQFFYKKVDDTNDWAQIGSDFIDKTECTATWDTNGKSQGKYLVKAQGVNEPNKLPPLATDELYIYLENPKSESSSTTTITDSIDISPSSGQSTIKNEIRYKMMPSGKFTTGFGANFINLDYKYIFKDSITVKILDTETNKECTVKDTPGLHWELGKAKERIISIDDGTGELKGKQKGVCDLYLKYNDVIQDIYRVSVGGGKPDVRTTGAEALTNSEGKIFGRIKGSKGFTITEYGFFYYPKYYEWSSNYDESDVVQKIVGNENLNDKFELTLSDLDANIEYVCFAYAVNELGYKFGERVEFRTYQYPFVGKQTKAYQDYERTIHPFTNKFAELAAPGENLSEGIFYAVTLNEQIVNKVIEDGMRGCFGSDIAYQIMPTYNMQKDIIDETKKLLSWIDDRSELKKLIGYKLINTWQESRNK